LEDRLVVLAETQANDLPPEGVPGFGRKRLDAFAVQNIEHPDWLLCPEIHAEVRVITLCAEVEVARHRVGANSPGSATREIVDRMHDGHRDGPGCTLVVGQRRVRPQELVAIAVVRDHHAERRTRPWPHLERHGGEDVALVQAVVRTVGVDRHPRLEAHRPAAGGPLFLNEVRAR
jgi:hypothetical protein